MPTKHWHKLEPDSPLQKEASLVTSPPNSLVLWRSDLLHKNYGGDYTAEELGAAGEPRLPRLTQFVTFSPKKYRTEACLQRKAQAVLDGCCNNHWAALALRVPITPFPAWSAPAKKIPVVRPRFSPSSSSDGQKDEEEEEQNEEESEEEKQRDEDEGEEEEEGVRGSLKRSRAGDVVMAGGGGKEGAARQQEEEEEEAPAAAKAEKQTAGVTKKKGKTSALEKLPPYIQELL
jgi:hypothetical protein